MAEISSYNGRPAIMIGGVPYPPMMATIRTNNRENLVLDKEYYRQLGLAGIRIFFLICDTVRLKPNALNLFREEAEALLNAVPDAYIIPRIGLHPTNKWIEEHPEETLTYSDGSRPPVHLFSESYETDLPAHYSLCSSKWRADTGEALRETWEALMRLPYTDRIIGCFLAAGGTSEWYYMLSPTANGKTLDYSESFRREFSAYLTDKYGSDENLQKRWHNPSATLENPPIPESDAHYYTGQVDVDAATPRCKMLSNSDVPPPYGNDTNIGAFIDIDRREDVWDFYRVWHLGVAGSVMHFAEVIKKLTPDKLVGAFYGSFGCTNYIKSGTCGGTLELLNCDAIDFLAAPGVYENRQPGGFVGQREMHDSFAIRNKIFIIEDDTRTCFENRYYQDKYGMYDLCDSIDVMKREFGRTICEDVQAWWFDQLLGGRRYKSPELYSLIASQQKIAHEAYENDRRKISEIAFIYDEKSAQAVSQQTTLELVELPRNYEIARIGAPVDQYFYNDFSNPLMPAYKMYVFFNTLVLTDAERKMIHDKLGREHAVAVWMYASGVINPDRGQKFDTANISELTGINIKRRDERFDAGFRFNGETHPISDDLDKYYVYGTFDRIRRNYATPVSYLYPLFYSEDSDADVPAYFLTSKVPAVTVKETQCFKSVFYGAKYIRAEVLRSFARYAHCHIYSDTDDVLFANRRYVTFHSSVSGKKTLKFPRPCSPYEVYEERYYGRGIQKIQFDMRLGETKMFRIDM